MIFGLCSDIHFTKKPYRLRKALRLLHDSDILLLIGDIADRGTREQYDAVFQMLCEEVPRAAVFPASGNHDLQQKDNYDAFERKVLETFSPAYGIERSETGAYYTRLNDDTDLISLNPLYHQKLFHFPEHGEQLAFLEERLSRSNAKRHIVLCHPPLIAHNPQRTADMPAYLPKEQDSRLQRIVDDCGNCWFLSGHTHVAPTVERDELHGNVYINDGSICPTTAGDNGETQSGNVFQFDFDGRIECKLLDNNEKQV